MTENYCGNHEQTFFFFFKGTLVWLFAAYLNSVVVVETWNCVLILVFSGVPMSYVDCENRKGFSEHPFYKWDTVDKSEWAICPSLSFTHHRKLGLWQLCSTFSLKDMKLYGYESRVIWRTRGWV